MLLERTNFVIFGILKTAKAAKFSLPWIFTNPGLFIPEIKIIKLCNNFTQNHHYKKWKAVSAVKEGDDKAKFFRKIEIWIDERENFNYINKYGLFHTRSLFANTDKKEQYKMIKKRRYSVIAVLAAVMIAITGCQSRTSSLEPSSSEPSSSSSSSEPEDTRPPYLFVNPLDPAGIIVPGIRPEQVETYDFTGRVTESRTINTDVGAHLFIPDTRIDEPILTSSQYGSMAGLQNIYDRTSNRLNWRKEGTGLGGSGVAYLHNRANINSRAELSPNLVIFGHNNGMPYGQTYNAAIPLKDLPDGAMFAQLYKFLDEEFATNHPYLFFSTEKENYIYQIFAVYWTEAEPNPPYWSSGISQSDALKVAQSAQERSQWIYDDVKLQDGDRYLTLSTCTYSFTTNLHAAESYRFVVQGRLLPENARLSPTAKITKNPSPKQPQV